MNFVVKKTEFYNNFTKNITILAMIISEKLIVYHYTHNYRIS